MEGNAIRRLLRIGHPQFRRCNAADGEANWQIGALAVQCNWHESVSFNDMHSERFIKTPWFAFCPRARTKLNRLMF